MILKVNIILMCLWSFQSQQQQVVMQEDTHPKVLKCLGCELHMNVLCIDNNVQWGIRTELLLYTSTHYSSELVWRFLMLVNITIHFMYR